SNRPRFGKPDAQLAERISSYSRAYLLLAGAGLIDWACAVLPARARASKAATKALLSDRIMTRPRGTVSGFRGPARRPPLRTRNSGGPPHFRSRFPSVRPEEPGRLSVHLSLLPRGPSVTARAKKSAPQGRCKPGRS